MITGLPERTLQSLSARGEIWGAAKLGRRWTFDRQGLRAWVKQQEQRAQGSRTSTSVTAFTMPGSRSATESSADRLRRAREKMLSGC